MKKRYSNPPKESKAVWYVVFFPAIIYYYWAAWKIHSMGGGYLIVSFILMLNTCAFIMWILSVFAPKILKKIKES